MANEKNARIAKEPELEAKSSPPIPFGWLADFGSSLIFGDRSLPGVRNIFRAAVFENFLGVIAFFAVLGMNRQQNVAVLNLSFVAFRLVLGNAKADEGPGQSSDGCDSGGACQRCHDRTGCDEYSESRNRKRTDPDHPAERAAKNCAAAGTRRRTFRSLGMLFVGEVFGALPVGKKHRHVVGRESGRFQIICDRDRLGLSLRNAYYGFLCHVVVPYLLTFDYELIVDFVRARDRLRFAGDRVLLRFAVDRSQQGNAAVDADDLDVVRERRE